MSCYIVTWLRQLCWKANGIGPRRTLRTPHIKLSRISYMSLMVLDSIPDSVYTYPMDLPIVLLQRLSSEGNEALKSLALDDSSASSATMRQHANRRLNTMVPKALSNLNNLLDSSEPKVQMTAISKVLDIAPATKPLDPRLEGVVSELPESAITALVAGLAAFGRGLGIGLTTPQPEGRPQPGPSQPNPEAQDIIVEVIPDKPKRGRPRKEKTHAVTKH
jgi:hypothetical protein